jgi:hypothetical protein
LVVARDHAGHRLRSGRRALAEGEVVQAIGALALFLAIPLGVSVLQHIDIPWRVVGPFVLVAVGLAIVVRAIARD